MNLTVFFVTIAGFTIALSVSWLMTRNSAKAELLAFFITVITIAAILGFAAS